MGSKKECCYRAKHGIEFEEILSVFNDDMAITRPDPDHNEDRWVTLGMVRSGKFCVVVVVHAYGHGTGQEIIRIISARKATKKERMFYEKKR
ncbi:MAG: BrnT family toxin [Pseudobdellovibrionaceae bacterium]|nr:BrnT family toxin [Pseudobdellovibrionaceae bacterium]